MYLNNNIYTNLVVRKMIIYDEGRRFAWFDQDFHVKTYIVG